MSPSPVLIAVVGAGECDESTAALATQVGQALAARGCWLVCGGLGGVMAAASQGAREAGGRTIGLLPGDAHSSANPWIEIVIPTGLGEARNLLVVRTAQAVIAIGGEWGTLSEIALARKLGRPVVALHSWQLRTSQGDAADILTATTAAEAVQLACVAAQRSLG